MGKLPWLVLRHTLSYIIARRTDYGLQDYTGRENRKLALVSPGATHVPFWVADFNVFSV